MKADEVDFSSPTFTDHPEGWQTPESLADAFVLAWALEMRARRGISPVAPLSSAVFSELPARFRFDTLGQLVRLPLSYYTPWQPPAYNTGPHIERGRLVTLCLVWRVYERLGRDWTQTTGDYAQFANTLSYVTGHTDRPSLFGARSADHAKCLLADRVLRQYEGQDSLTVGEEWYATGAKQLLDSDGSLPFWIGGGYLPQHFPDDIFVASIWSLVQVYFDLSPGVDFVALHSQRTETLLDVLERGAKLSQERKTLPPAAAAAFDVWPGWSD